jgi:hypothetical protein
MAKQKIETVALHGWQQNIIDCIEKHDELRDSEQYQGLSDYSVNRSLGIVAAFPRGSGHTFLANYIASVYPSVLLYNKMGDYIDVTKTFPLHNNTDTISTFEIYYALHKPDLRTPSPEYLDIRARFQQKKVVVVDKGLSLPDDVKHFLYDAAQGIVIFLGH